MPTVENFLYNYEEEEVIEAIREVEQYTSGEIRVHIENEHHENAYLRARQVFHLLKMDNTLLRNGVLIYIAVDTKKFAIIGDKGINDQLHLEFWQAAKDSMEAEFRNGNYKDGLVNCIKETGKVLAQHFPWSPFDENELTDEISKKE